MKLLEISDSTLAVYLDQPLYVAIIHRRRYCDVLIYSEEITHCRQDVQTSRLLRLNSTTTNTFGLNLIARQIG